MDNIITSSVGECWQNFSILSTMLWWSGLIFVMCLMQQRWLSMMSNRCERLRLPHGGIGTSSMLIRLNFRLRRKFGRAGEFSLTESLSKLWLIPAEDGQDREDFVWMYCFVWLVVGEYHQRLLPNLLHLPRKKLCKGCFGRKEDLLVITLPTAKLRDMSSESDWWKLAILWVLRFFSSLSSELVLELSSDWLSAEWLVYKSTNSHHQ